MRTDVKRARLAQLIGAALLVVGVVSCSTRAGYGVTTYSFLVGFTLIVGGKIREWLIKE